MDNWIDKAATKDWSQINEIVRYAITIIEKSCPRIKGIGGKNG